jgi:hypothetical protein
MILDVLYEVRLRELEDTSRVMNQRDMRSTRNDRVSVNGVSERQLIVLEFVGTLGRMCNKIPCLIFTLLPYLQIKVNCRLNSRNLRSIPKFVGVLFTCHFKFG